MSKAAILAKAFSKYFDEGEASLSSVERDYYLIQNVIIDREMSSLEDYLMNNIEHPEVVRGAIEAMKKYNMIEFSRQLQMAFVYFSEFWNVDHCITDFVPKCSFSNETELSNMIDDITKIIDSLDQYGIPHSTIS